MNGTSKPLTDREREMLEALSSRAADEWDADVINDAHGLGADFSTWIREYTETVYRAAIARATEQS